MTGTVQFQSIDKTFPNGVRALRNVHLRLPPRQLTTLLGPSGCGKTTLLRMVAGLERPSAGRVLIGGLDVTDMGSEQRPISMVFQSYALFPHLNVLDNVRYGLRTQKLTPQECDSRALAALAAVSMQTCAQNSTTMLSGGQQQRVALARALALRPQVLLLDEPLSNLDAGLRRQIREDIRALQQSLGLTVMYVTHDHHEAMAVSDTVVVMREGQVMQMGTPREVYEAPHCEFVAAFMGDAVMFDAQADASGSVQLGPLLLGPGLTRRQGKVRLVVRPHAWRLAPASGDGLAGRILSRAYLGRNTEYQVLTVLGVLLVLVQGEVQPRQIESPVSVHLGLQGVSVLMPSGLAWSDKPMPVGAAPAVAQQI
ncbi:MAG: ABC transporter ATP-binding protein [Pseudomonadota bacterium]